MVQVPEEWNPQQCRRWSLKTRGQHYTLANIQLVRVRAELNVTGMHSMLKPSAVPFLTGLP
jgi:hypothetical protein